MDAEETQRNVSLLDSHPLDLVPDAFWQGPEGAMGDYVLGAMKRGQRGTLIDVPDVVELLLRTTLPMVGCDIVTDRALSLSRFREQALVVAISPETGRVLVQAAFEPPSEPPAPLPQFAGADTEGVNGSTFALDLFERPGIPAVADEWIVTVIARDRVSNRIRTSLVDDATVWHDPAVAAYLAQRRREAGPPAPSPPPAPAGHALPSYRHEPISPPMPQSTGIALGVERVVAIEPRARCVLAGSFRLPVMEGSRVPAARRAPGGPSAVLSITLVVTTSDAPGAVVLRLAVPVYDLPDTAEEARGYFALDLFTMPGIAQRPRTCFVYAFAGEEMAGPTPVALVDADLMLSLR